MVQEVEQIDRLRLELRGAMLRSSEGRMKLAAACAEAAANRSLILSIDQVREADTWCAEAEAKWLELDAHLARGVG